MTTTPAPDSPGWLAHRARQIWAALFIAAGVLTLIAPNEVREPVTSALMLAAVACWPITRKHDGRLCARCVAEWPADGEARAERTAAFWVHHRTAPALLVTLAAYIVAVAVDHDSFPARIAFAVMAAANAAVLIAGRRHAQLLPWCPYCRDEGDDYIHDPTSAPDPSGVKNA